MKEFIQKAQGVYDNCQVDRLPDGVTMYLDGRFWVSKDGKWTELRVDA